MRSQEIKTIKTKDGYQFEFSHIGSPDPLQWYRMEELMFQAETNRDLNPKRVPVYIWKPSLKQRIDQLEDDINK